MSFNFEKIGVPIAKIEGGLKNKEILYLSEPSDKDKVKNGFNEIKLDKDAKFQPLPRKKIVEKLYVSAPSGSGKSYYSGKWIKEFNKAFRDQEVYLFSPIPSDKALDSNNIVRVDLDEHLIGNPITVEELEDSLVVFDDCESIKDKRILKYIEWLRDSILETGRHFNVRMVWISHLISNYSSTRRLLNESTSVTVFPRSGSGVYQIKAFLQRQCGLSKNEITRFLSQDSRWCTVYRTYPQYVITEKSCYFPKIDD
jgi:hypothetical protein